ncbi:biotin--[acetyl-CoA-carboxylase] ligase [Chloroflexota bacterium]
MKENKLSKASISTNLKTKYIGQRIIYYPKLVSTMDTSLLKVRQRVPQGTVIVTSEQTGGRGRLKRVWLSPKGNLTLSIILYPHAKYLPALIMVASLAVVHCIRAITDLNAEIKWPNDVLINDKKVCGILIESGLLGNTVDYSIIGIGLNVNLKLHDIIKIKSSATSLSDELGEEVSLVDTAQCLLSNVESSYLALLAGEPIYEEWRDRLISLGHMVSITSGNIIYEGIAESVANDGSLLLRHPDGSTTKVVAGDVSQRF